MNVGRLKSDRDGAPGRSRFAVARSESGGSQPPMLSEMILSILATEPKQPASDGTKPKFVARRSDELTD